MIQDQAKEMQPALGQPGGMGEDLTRVLVDHLHAGLWLIDAKERTAYVNAQMGRILGYLPEEMVGRPLWDFMPESSRAQCERNLEHRRQGVGEDHEFVLTHRDGRPRRVIMLTSPVLDRGGVYQGALATVLDVTQQERWSTLLGGSLALNAAVGRLLPSLLAPSASVGTVASVVLAEAQALTGSPDGFVASIDPVTRELVAHTLTDLMPDECTVTPEQQRFAFPPRPGGRYPGLWGHVLNTRQALVANEARAHPASEGLPKGHLAVERFAGVPVVLQGELVGQIAVANSCVAYDDDDVVALARLADVFALAIGRVRSEQGVRRERDFSDAVLSTAGSLILVMDCQGRILRFNRYCEKMTGYREEEVRGQRFWERFLVPEELDGVRRVFGQLKAGHFPLKHENYWVTRSGDRRWIRWSNTALLDGEGKVEYIVATGVDSTEQRAAESRLREAHDQLERTVEERTQELSRTVEQLTREVQARVKAEEEVRDRLEFEQLLTQVSYLLMEVKPDAIQGNLRAALSVLAEHLGSDRSTLGEFGPDDTLTVTLQWVLNETPVAPERMPLSDFPWTLLHIQAGEIVCVSKLAHLPPEAGKDQEAFNRLGTRSVLVIPLVLHGRSVGVLTFSSVVAERDWDSLDLSRFRLVGELFGNVLVRLRTERKLAETEERYHAIADFLNDWEYWEGPDGRLRYCSPGCERITGRPAPDFIADPNLINDMVLAEDRGVWDSHRSEARSGQRQSILQFRIRHRDGSVRWIEHACRAVAGRLGSFQGFRVSNRDITRERETELETQRLRAELATVNRMTSAGQLAAALAHELNQPLTAILCNARAAQRMLEVDAPDLAEVNTVLGEILEDDERAGQVIARLRAMFRKGTGGYAPLQLNAVVTSTLRLLRSELIMRGAALEMDLADALPMISGNHVELEQVILNLVMNGLDAMAEVEPLQRRLVVRTSRGGSGEVCVTVRDSGPGIPADLLSRLGEPMLTTKTTGMGMGLAICRSIIEAHQGRLEFRNHDAGGAEVAVALPACSEEAK